MLTGLKSVLSSAMAKTKLRKIRKHMLFWLGADLQNLNSAIKGYQVWLNINGRALKNTTSRKIRTKIKEESLNFQKNLAELRFLRGVKQNRQKNGSR